MFRLGSVLLLAIGGGTISLMRIEQTVGSLVLSALGLIASVILGTLLYRLQGHIRRLIKEV